MIQPCDKLVIWPDSIHTCYLQRQRLTLTAFLASFSIRFVAFLFASPTARFFAAAGFLVDRSPSATLGFVFGHAALFITFFYVLGLTLLLIRICSLVSFWHYIPPCSLWLKTGCGSRFQAFDHLL